MLVLGIRGQRTYIESLNHKKDNATQWITINMMPRGCDDRLVQTSARRVLSTHQTARIAAQPIHLVHTFPSPLRNGHTYQVTMGY